MTYLIENHAVQCPYCGETFEALLDTTVDAQTYIEDCEICCKPITFRVNLSLEGRVEVELFGENE